MNMDTKSISLFETTKGTKRKSKDSEIHYTGNCSTHAAGLLLLRQRLMKNVAPLHNVRSDCKKLKQKDSELNLHKLQSVKKEQNNDNSDMVINKQHLLIKEEPKDYLKNDSMSIETYCKTSIKPYINSKQEKSNQVSTIKAFDKIKTEPENSEFPDSLNIYNKNHSYTATYDIIAEVKKEPSKHLAEPENTVNMYVSERENDPPKSFSKEVNLDSKVKKNHIYNPELYRKDTQILGISSNKAEPTNHHGIIPHMVHNTKAIQFETSEVSLFKDRNIEEHTDPISSEGSFTFKKLTTEPAYKNSNTTTNSKKLTTESTSKKSTIVLASKKSTIALPCKKSTSTSTSKKSTSAAEFKKKNNTHILKKSSISSGSRRPGLRSSSRKLRSSSRNIEEHTDPISSEGSYAFKKLTTAPAYKKSNTTTKYKKLTTESTSKKSTTVLASKKSTIAPPCKKSTSTSTSKKSTSAAEFKKKNNTHILKKSSIFSGSRRPGLRSSSRKLRSSSRN